MAGPPRAEEKILDELHMLASRLSAVVARKDEGATRETCLQMTPLIDVLDHLAIPGASPSLSNLRRHVHFPSFYAARGQWEQIGTDPADCLQDISAVRAKLGISKKPSEPWWDLIHPSVRKIAESRFAAGHRADAVEAALKEVNNRVKRRYKLRAKSKNIPDGKALMFQAFPLDRPRIRLSKLSTESDRDEQEGYMHLFAGAMQALRNPKAHANLDIDEDRARHHLFVASLLMAKLDEARVPA